VWRMAESAGRPLPGSPPSLEPGADTNTPGAQEAGTHR